jgi:hypothetical protein
MLTANELAEKTARYRQWRPKKKHDDGQDSTTRHRIALPRIAYHARYGSSAFICTDIDCQSYMQSKSQWKRKQEPNHTHSYLTVTSQSTMPILTHRGVTTYIRLLTTMQERLRCT